LEAAAFFAKGLVIGVAVAAPVGPIGVLCIQRTLAGGRLMGFVSGLGAATADAVYGAIAGFGLTLVADFLVAQATWLRLVGGVFLLYLGVRTFLDRPAEPAAGATRGSLVAAYGSVAALTAANPATILSFVAIFAGFGVAGTGGHLGLAAALVAGVFLGSAAWWLALSFGAGLARRRTGPELMRRVNRVSGVVIAAFGVAALAAAL